MVLKQVVTVSFIAATFLLACESEGRESVATDNTQFTNKVVLSSEIEWQPLNPARGDNSPRAGTIWGDRNGVEPTGFLAKFKDGFSSPPHIHNVTYRAIVISGLIHNDDPSAEIMWMPAGSFWTQPAGASHITAAKGEENIAYVEIDQGPYLVNPVEEAIDNGERPVNLDKTNIVWLDASQSNVIDGSSAQSTANGPKVAFLWANGELTGTFIKLPSGFEGEINSNGDIFHAVVITGDLSYKMPKTGEVKSLDAGSYFTSKGKAVHQIATEKEEIILYIRTNGAFNLTKIKE